MAKIQVLDKHIAELIAAGEVVERPSSVIKELVENSIDAGASAVTVEIRNGGVTFMRVTDNGSGMPREEVPTALLRHATSKVSDAADLDAIHSLGFRGEALASISAVSHMEILTRGEGEELGVRLTADGGEVTDFSDAGCPGGTTLVVRNLFYNVPARMKFLKKDVGEGNAVAGVLDKIALSHPEIAFKLIRDGRETLHTPGDGKLSSAIYGVYGKDFLATLIPMEYALGGIRVWGYISAPSGARPNRAMQNFFINGRYVRSRTAMAALEEGFKGSVTVGKFPACVLHMTVDFSAVDVNVHPAKLEVRFTNERPVFDAVYHGVKSALMEGDRPKAMGLTPKRPQVSPYTPKETPVEQTRLSSGFSPPSAGLPRLSVPPKPAPQVSAPLRTAPGPVLYDSEKSKIPEKIIPTKIEQLIDEPPEQTEPPKAPSMEKTAALTPPRADDSSLYKLVGEAFSTYIVLETEKGLMLIDKHAAHERLLYEQLKAGDAGKAAQSLLSPIPVTLDKLSYSAVVENLAAFDAAGFAMEDFGGGTVLVRSAPLSLSGQDVAEAVIEIAGQLVQNRGGMSTEYMDWLYHNIACRAAIKGGQKSGEQELIALARALHENPQLRYCPHGRPVFILIEKHEIEKQFKRQ